MKTISGGLKALFVDNGNKKEGITDAWTTERVNLFNPKKTITTITSLKCHYLSVKDYITMILQEIVIVF